MVRVCLAASRATLALNEAEWRSRAPALRHLGIDQKPPISLTSRAVQETGTTSQAWTKRYVVRSRGYKLPWRGWRTTGREARPHPGAIEEVNEVTPLPPREGKLTAKEADEAAEEG
jgi:hypothetical protein